MAALDIIAPTESHGELPVVRTIALSDLKDALAKGLDDFWAMPTHLVFLCLIYPIGGGLLWRAALGADLVPLLYPIATGFALVGPFAAIGLYELSRRREQGLDTSWKHVFDVVHSPSIWSIAALGCILLAIFCVWIAVAHSLSVAAFGYHRSPETIASFTRTVLTTPAGRDLIVAGNVIGLLFAAVSFVLSVVSFPLLLDRNVGFATAVITSVKVVAANPLVMATWGLIVAAALVIGSLPLLSGLAVIVPILGHATWHLYRKVVVPDSAQRPTYEARPAQGRRYAAEFPASLFAKSRHTDQ